MPSTEERRIKYMEISYPNFTLGQIIDPEEANQNNSDIVNKMNEFVDEVEGAIVLSEGANQQSLDAISIANEKGDDAISKSSNALIIATESNDMSKEALFKADEVYNIKPALEQAVIDSNSNLEEIYKIIGDAIFEKVGISVKKGIFISPASGELSFELLADVYNPNNDYLEIYYMDKLLHESKDFTISNRNVNLLFEIDIDDEIYYKSFKNVLIDTELSDGSFVIDGTITDSKLDDGVGQIKQRVNSMNRTLSRVIVELEISDRVPSSGGMFYDLLDEYNNTKYLDILHGIAIVQTPLFIGSTEVIVNNTDEISEGEYITIFDDVNIENRKIESISGQTLTVAPLTKPFKRGAEVSRSNVELKDSKLIYQSWGNYSIDITEVI